MPTDFDDPSDSDPEASRIARMRRIIAEYESFDDPYLKSEYLAACGLTRDTIRNYRELIARADLRASDPTSHGSATRRARAPRRSRDRRTRVAPSSRAYDTTRPGDSRRNRGVRNRVVFIIVRIYRFPDAP